MRLLGGGFADLTGGSTINMGLKETQFGSDQLWRESSIKEEVLHLFLGRLLCLFLTKGHSLPHANVRKRLK